MKLSAKGRDFLKRHETYGGVPNLTEYKDAYGVETIGYGHAVKDGEDFRKRHLQV
jgi:GH24 family phage-related lysozyme (muramidase)